MKANQAFKAEDEAVSPVVGVILMVAITVVLAAVVFVLVNNLGKGTSSAPNLSFTVNDQQDRLEIVSAATGANWNRLTVVATQCTTANALAVGSGTGAPPATQHYDVAATSAAHANISSNGCTGTNTPIALAAASGTIVAGDYMAFCAVTTAAINVNIQIVDTGANSQVGTFSFPTIGICT